MEREFSKPLVELPAFLSTISMVVDDLSAIVQKLIQAERKSPAIYTPTRDLFCRVLEGGFSFEEAIHQAHRLFDETERKCAIEVLRASEKFLRTERSAPITAFPNMSHSLPNGMELNVSPMLLRHFNPERLMVLHFWRAPLSEWQLSAAGAVIRSAIYDQQPQYRSCEIDFISIPLPEFAFRRRFERYNWTKLKPHNAAEMARFWRQFLAGWTEYQRKGPREIKRKRAVGLFD
jgi:hypothetical protein